MRGRRFAAECQDILQTASGERTCTRSKQGPAGKKEKRQFARSTKERSGWNERDSLSWGCHRAQFGWQSRNHLAVHGSDGVRCCLGSLEGDKAKATRAASVLVKHDVRLVVQRNTQTRHTQINFTCTGFGVKSARTARIQFPQGCAENSKCGRQALCPRRRTGLRHPALSGTLRAGNNRCDAHPSGQSAQGRAPLATGPPMRVLKRQQLQERMARVGSARRHLARAVELEGFFQSRVVHIPGELANVELQVIDGALGRAPRRPPRPRPRPRNPPRNPLFKPPSIDALRARSLALPRTTFSSRGEKYRGATIHHPLY